MPTICFCPLRHICYALAFPPWGKGRRVRERQAMSDDIQQIFTSIYRLNAWGGTESVSGTGSGLMETRAVRTALRSLIEELAIATLLDIPCGDFHWMRETDLRGVGYTGGDIVDDLVAANRSRFGRPGRTFLRLDLLSDALPRVDFVFCRDCLVHFSFSDVFRALDNVCRSGSTYLMATTFTGRDENVDIATGRWRVLNLERAPFALPAPLRIIAEECVQGDGAYADKSLGLWRVADLRDHLDRSRARS